MATSGSAIVNVAKAGGSYVDGIRLQLKWTQRSQSVANNTTTIRLELYCLAGKYGNLVGTASQNWNIKVNGSTKKSGTWTVNPVGNNENYRIGYVDVTIKHASDGKGSFSASGYAQFNMDFNGWVSSKTVSLSGTLNTIPRASSCNLPTFTAGTAGKFTITRASSSFTHTITYKIGNASGTIVTKTTSTTPSWTPPLSLMNQFPNATSGKVTITITTYSRSTNIGSKSGTLTLNAAASAVPTISNGSLVLNNSANSVVNSWGVCVKGYSKVTLKASAAGTYGSTIKSFVISGAWSGTINQSTLSYDISIGSAGTKQFSAYAKDSRGRNSSTISLGSITALDYSPPVATGLTVRRSDEDSETMYAKGNWTYSTVGGHNVLTVLLQYRKKGEADFTPYGSIPQNSEVKLNGVFSEMNTYEFNLVVTDSLGNSSSIGSSVATTSVLLNFKVGGKGFGIGKIAETDSMEVSLPSVFYGNSSFNGGVEFNGNITFPGEIIDLEPYLVDTFSAYTGTPVIGRKIGCIVYIAGAVAPKADTATNTSIIPFLNLPEGWKPTLDLNIIMQGSTMTRWLLTIRTDGTVGMSRYGNDSYTTVKTSNWLPFQAMYMTNE